MVARQWLRENEYSDVADMIDEIMAEWRSTGNGSRRNWWETLAGGENGRPYHVAGREFPVLRAAQVRQGKAVTADSVSRRAGEEAPDVMPCGRWAMCERNRTDHAAGLEEEKHVY